MVRFACVASVLLLMTGAAAAQTATTPPAPATPFNMKGTWKGNNDVIVDGPTGHHPATASAKAAGPYRLRTMPVTLQFDGQDGRRFWGTMSSDNRTNRLIGALSFDDKWAYLAGFEGLVDAQIVDPDTIEVCYRHANSTSAVVGCNLLKRQK